MDRSLRPMLVLLTLLLSFQQVAAQVATPATTTPMDRYTVEARFDPGARQVTGSLILDWTNSTGAPQTRLPFRLYSNASAYENGGVDVFDVNSDGEPLPLTVTVDPTVIWMDLPRIVPSGESVRIAMSFVTTIPTDTSMSVNVLHGDATNGWWLADWHPVLAGWEPGYGWYLEPPGLLGNPTFATSAAWSLTMTLPADLAVFGTGQVVDAGLVTTGERSISIETPPARDLTLVLLPEADLVITERDIAGLSTRLTLPSALASPDLVDLVMTTAAEVLPFYKEVLGDLPGTELDLLPVDLAGFGGIAWSGAIWLDLDAAGGLDPKTSASLRFVLAHELAHQWVPIAIGSNNNRHNFLSESLASHLALLALAAAGVPGIDAYFAGNVVAPYRSMLERGEDGVVDDSAASTVATAGRVALVYGKGVLGFEAIRQAVGTDPYLAGLARYAETFRFGVSTPEDLLLAFEAASGQNLAHLWEFWFTSAVSTPADIDAILTGLSSLPQP